MPLYWDPKPELFFLPILGWPILWYSLFFALGFIVGFPLFSGVMQRFFLQRPEFLEKDIVLPWPHSELASSAKKGITSLLKELNQWLFSNEPISIEKKSCFAKASLHPEIAARRLQLESLLSKGIFSFKRQAVFLTDRLVVYMVVATVLGARLGHFLFYERPSDYLRHPLEILQIWKGGLSSHGAAFAILIALWIFMLRYRTSLRGATWLNLLDFVAMPTAFAGALIRVGNFFNQEILGTETNVPWAVIFGHPADRSLPLPRHPVQLYEALAYFVIFLFLKKLTFQPKYLLNAGKIFGLFLVGVFGFRLVAESFKLEQSQFGSFMGLTMGQLLSVPLVVLGIYLVFRKKS
jgi:prolipoprotein diacylglyceryl transferase